MVILGEIVCVFCSFRMILLIYENSFIPLADLGWISNLQKGNCSLNACCEKFGPLKLFQVVWINIYGSLLNIVITELCNFRYNRLIHQRTHRVVGLVRLFTRNFPAFSDKFPDIDTFFYVDLTATWELLLESSSSK